MTETINIMIISPHLNPPSFALIPYSSKHLFLESLYFVILLTNTITSGSRLYLKPILIGLAHSCLVVEPYLIIINRLSLGCGFTL